MLCSDPHAPLFHMLLLWMFFLFHFFYLFHIFSAVLVFRGGPTGTPTGGKMARRDEKVFAFLLQAFAGASMLMLPPGELPGYFAANRAMIKHPEAPHESRASLNFMVRHVLTQNRHANRKKSLQFLIMRLLRDGRHKHHKVTIMMSTTSPQFELMKCEPNTTMLRISK